MELGAHDSLVHYRVADRAVSRFVRWSETASAQEIRSPLVFDSTFSNSNPKGVDQVKRMLGPAVDVGAAGHGPSHPCSLKR